MRRIEAEQTLMEVIDSGILSPEIEEKLTEINYCIGNTIHGLGSESFEGASSDCDYANGEYCGWRDTESGQTFEPVCDCWRDCPDRLGYFEEGDGSEPWPKS